MKKHIYHLIAVLCITSLSEKQAWSQELPQAGQLIITEFMSNPSAVSDTKGEWFEILNISNKTLKLNGLNLSDEGNNKHTIAADSDILVSPGKYFVFARNGETAENGGLTPDYVYSNFSLGNSEDEIIISLSDGTLIEEISYDSSWPLYAGASCELAPDKYLTNDNHNIQYWHPAVEIYGQGDFGTPGKINSVATYNFKYDDIVVFEAFPNPTTGPLSVRLKLNNNVNVKINLVNLLGQNTQLFNQDAEGTLYIPLSLTYTEPGIYWLVVQAGEKKICQKIIYL